MNAMQRLAELESRQAWRVWNADVAKDLKVIQVTSKRRGTKQTMDEIVAAVSREAHIGRKDIMGDCRIPHIASARQYAMYLCAREIGNNSEVARYFDRDSSTVRHARKKMERLLDKGAKRDT